MWHLMTGRPLVARVALGLRKPKNPVRGWDGAGRVEAVGAKVTEFKPGDEVFGNCEGSFAEFARAKARRLVLKPPNLTFEQAAALPVSGMTALQALQGKGRPQPGDQVLVIGASGGVGSFAVQLAAMYGAVVTGVCGPTNTELRTLPGRHPRPRLHPRGHHRRTRTATTSSSTARAFAPCPSCAASSLRAAPSSWSAARAGPPSSAG